MAENKQIISGNICLFSLDTIEKIFSYLNIKDLRRAAGVCWYWYEVVKREFSIRSTIQSLILPVYISPFKYGFDFTGEELKSQPFWQCAGNHKFSRGKPSCKEIDLTSDANWHLSDAVRSVPKLCFVFAKYIDTFYPCTAHCFECMRSLPHSGLFAGITFMRITVDGTEILEDTKGSGISIPSTPNLKCEMLNITDKFECESEDHDSSMNFELFPPYPIDDIFRNLNMNTTDTHNCFIIFLNRNLICNSIWKYDAYVTEFLENLKKRYELGTYSVFGTGCFAINTSSNCNIAYFLRIHGSALRSWSIVINLDLPEEEMKTKLLNLKKKIHVNWSTIALCAVPYNGKKYFGDFRLRRSKIVFFDPSKIFKEVFPSVTLTCFYDARQVNYFRFGCNTLDNESEPVFEHENSMVFLLVTTS